MKKDFFLWIVMCVVAGVLIGVFRDLFGVTVTSTVFESRIATLIDSAIVLICTAPAIIFATRKL